MQLKLATSLLSLLSSIKQLIMVLDHMKAVGPELAAVLPQDGIPWYKKAFLRRLNFSVFCLVLFSSANGYDGSMMNGLQALPQWGIFMHNPTGAYLGFVVAVQSLGATVSFPAVAFANNKFGRKKTIAFGYTGLIIGVILTTAAHNQAMFILGRFFIGMATACVRIPGNNSFLIPDCFMSCKTCLESKISCNS